MTVRSGNRRRVGVFGGTFDPIHYGHLRAAEEARESFDLDLVLFVPSAIPPHKPRRKVTNAFHRMEMVRLAVESHPAFRASDLECGRSGVSYSVETLNALKEGQAAEAEIYFLIGLDAFMRIHTWKSYEDLFRLSHWIVLERSGYGPMGRAALPATMRSFFRYDHDCRAWVHASGKRVFFKRFRSLEISGTEIRRLVREGRSVRYLVPEKVAHYMSVWGLYQA
ncbi:MAG: nicotinate-nucleotide adenylyltransferase [Thermodesulfobacteriota bacterium]